MDEQKTDVEPLFCARCAAALEPGAGTYYRVAIEAVADPGPVIADASQSAADLRLQIEELLARLENVSEREALDQVYRRLTIYLCGACFQGWIENPAR